MSVLKKICWMFMSFCIGPVFGQTVVYTVANAHSHNDYLQRNPFYEAYNEQFGSIEADIHLFKGLLVVAHDPIFLTTSHTLESMYLVPLSKCIELNDGYAFKDSSRKLQLLIDLKTNGVATLNALVDLLKKFPSIIHNPSLRIVITGNRPAEDMYNSYPAYIWFDGDADKEYSKAALSRIVMFSDNFAKYSRWKGNGPLPDSAKVTITELINKAHRLHKPIRFWGCPDFIQAWKEMMQLNVDFINTDHIAALSDFLMRQGD